MEGRPPIVRVCVVDSPELGDAYPRLRECGFECMAVVASIEEVDARLLIDVDAVLVGCSDAEFASPTFRRSALRIARLIPSIALVSAGADAATAARLGFRGLVDRDVSPSALLRTVEAVLHGELGFPRSALVGLLRLSGDPRAATPADGGPAALTPRQQQIVDLIAQGATDREIASRLRISQSTAHKHVQNALRRLNARTRSQLVAVISHAEIA
jgi:DNA-binding NarL/FixJ family response regulator